MLTPNLYHQRFHYFCNYRLGEEWPLPPVNLKQNDSFAMAYLSNFFFCLLIFYNSFADLYVKTLAISPLSFWVKFNFVL